MKAGPKAATIIGVHCNISCGHLKYRSDDDAIVKRTVDTVYLEHANLGS